MTSNLDNKDFKKELREDFIKLRKHLDRQASCAVEACKKRRKELDKNEIKLYLLDDIAINIILQEKKSYKSLLCQLALLKKEIEENEPVQFEIEENILYFGLSMCEKHIYKKLDQLKRKLEEFKNILRIIKKNNSSVSNMIYGEENVIMKRLQFNDRELAGISKKLKLKDVDSYLEIHEKLSKEEYSTDEEEIIQ